MDAWKLKGLEKKMGNKNEISYVDAMSKIEAVLKNDKPPAEQRPSMGCNIKWKKANEPDYS